MQWTLPKSIAALVLTVGAVAAHAQDVTGVSDVTMRLLPADATLPDAVTKTIVLPDTANEHAVEHSAAGLETANAARERVSPGPETAAAAREDGRAFGAESAAAAREHRENLGRGEPPELPNLPDLSELPNPPDQVELPEPAGLPELPTLPTPGRP